MRSRLRPLLLLSLLALACGCKKTPTETPAVATSPAAPTGIDIEDPRTCAPCHQAVVAEWKQSMHAAAHHAHDPIYAAVRALRVQREGESIVAACAQCHTPRAESPDSKDARRGVACAACHNVQAVHLDKRGRDALVPAAPGLLLGPHDVAPNATVAHGTGPAAPHLADGQTMCLACHGELKSATGVPICTTGPEHAALPPGDADGAPAQTCVSCHMPVVNEPSGALSPRKEHRSHAFVGPHRAWRHDDLSPLTNAVTLAGAWTADGLRITLKNKTGHGFPSGFPGRMAVLTVRGFGAADTASWTPAPVILGKRYEDADGKPTLAPWAERLASDTRLKPAETREVALQPPVGLERIEATLAFRLLPPPLAKKLKLSDRPEATPRLIQRIEWTPPSPGTQAD